MIVTHTSNPSIDYYLELQQGLENGVQRAKESYCLAGGKGLNVSMLLNQLNMDSLATAYLGGFTGDFIRKQMEQYPHITPDFIEVEQMSRINVKIRGFAETDINAGGPVISTFQQGAMLSRFEKLKENDWLLICGSLAQNVSADFLLAAASLSAEKKARLVLDVPNISAELIAACRPYLIKPNLEELSLMFKDSAKGAKEEMIRWLLAGGVKNILLSKGAKGAEFYSLSQSYQVTQPELRAINTVGSGDSMLAAFVGMIDQGQSVKEALAWAAAAGAATAASKGLAVWGKIQQIKESVVVTQKEKLR